jgi:ABC-type transport system involved in cytochrome c biogenesis permease subunit
MKKWLPLILFAVFAAWAGKALMPPKDKFGQFAVQDFGRLPVLTNGRVQPLDSLARNSLLQLREKQTANVEPWKDNMERPKILSATEWLMAMLMDPAKADAIPVIRIDNPDLKGLLSLPMDADKEKQTDGKHFSWVQIREKLGELQTEANRAGKLDQSHRTPFDQAVLHLWNGVGIYMRLQNTLQPQNAKNWSQEFAEYRSHVPAGVTAARAQQAGQPFDEAALDALMTDLSRFDAMRQLEPPLLVPPHGTDDHQHGWMRMGEALMEVARGDTPHFSITGYAQMAGAYRDGRIEDFNRAVTEYRAALSTQFGTELQKTKNEQWFNAFAPFYKSLTLYVVAGLCALGFWVNPGGLEWLRRSAVWLVVLALIIHTAGLIFRMTLEGRPPVTNLYSSAIFIGWGACILGLILERFWRNSIGVVVSSVVGFLTLIVAHHLSLSGDTMEMMRAVLDTNFWLATHVVVVTLGYASTFVAGFLAIVYIVRGLFTTGLDPATGKSLSKMVYGIVCFAALFSFVGTVLGGIWADQSWGRFWGWDPKENGALIIVLWNALILHARWGGLVKERGLMALAIGGNIVTSWSWFGVNMLGIGLHSYGFMDAAFRWLMLFVGSQVALILLSAIPLRLWRSFRGSDDPQLPEGRPVAA